MKLAKQIGAVIALIAVCAIFIAPAVDMQPTALTASRAAQQLLIGFTFLAAVIAAHLHTEQVAAAHSWFDAGVSPLPDIIDLTCARLC